ncbi:nuclear transport factor 2 family protein [Streptomyces cucumeris]|uniref:nuclear transport factor 2 family protein n=1 Tax=Streptomyces cucumeris TaxID=2962890 RepID=UPI003D74484F
MSNTEQTEQTKALAERFYELAIVGEDAELRWPDYRLTHVPEHPMAGSWTGAEADAARARVLGTLGLTSFKVNKVVGVGPDLAVGLLEVQGADANGKTWQQPLVEFLHFRDGKITHIRPNFWDVEELHRVVATRTGGDQ